MLSPPARRRGSKPVHSANTLPPSRRLPRGGVDRNYHAARHARHDPVASRAEAWIETIPPTITARAWRSPPARRRGSKLGTRPDGRITVMSPPARRRGSKRQSCRHYRLSPQSPPARRRGSKPETVLANSRWQPVASRAEAWIETADMIFGATTLARRLPRGGVDRKTVDAARTDLARESPPARRRGSKRRCRGAVRSLEQSPPARRRGSKQRGDLHPAHQRRRLPRGGVDRNDRPPSTWRVHSGRLPRGGVDRNTTSASVRIALSRRLPRGGVDRNAIAPDTRAARARVASRAEAWIETRRVTHNVGRDGVASRAEAWIETTRRSARCASATGRLPRGGVDRNRRR